ncbi:MAG TPA: thermonuclease family protein [Pyrinomonadaceae bacterium]|nr:thermonuclease family protein [Pyrinomonadaceae bacterium]
MQNLLTRTRICAALVFVALIGISVSGQIKTAGEVVDLADGNAIVVAVSTGRIVVELQYVQLPEPGQSLYTVVRDHLRSLVVGKTVLLQTTGITRGKVTGKLTIDGIDVSQQLLRDGAAWHTPIDMSGQNEQEFGVYAGSAALARGEKRGIWAVAGLKAPWVIRAENDAMRHEAEAAARQGKPTLVGVSQFGTDTRGSAGKPAAAVSARSQMDAWVDTFAFSRNEGYGVHVFREPNGRYQVVYSSPIMIELNSRPGKERLECRVMYVTGTRYDGTAARMYMLGFRAISEDYRFSKTKTRLTAVVDGKALSLGNVVSGLRAQGMIAGGGMASGEVMYFTTNKTSIRKMADAANLEFRINNYTGTVPAGTRDLFKQIAAAGD